jgi:ferritin-like protein
MLAEQVQEAIGLLQGFTADKCKDGELAEDEIKQMIEELETIIAALRCSLEQTEEACNAAATQGREARTEI